MAMNEETVKSNQMLEEEDESFNFSKDIGTNRTYDPFQNLFSNSDFRRGRSTNCHVYEDKEPG